MNEFLNWVFIMFMLMSPYLITVLVKSSFILGMEFRLGVQVRLLVLSTLRAFANDYTF